MTKVYLRARGNTEEEESMYPGIHSDYGPARMASIYGAVSDTQVIESEFNNILFNGKRPLGPANAGIGVGHPCNGYGVNLMLKNPAHRAQIDILATNLRSTMGLKGFFNKGQAKVILRNLAATNPMKLAAVEIAYAQKYGDGDLTKLRRDLRRNFDRLNFFRIGGPPEEIKLLNQAAKVSLPNASAALHYALKFGRSDRATVDEVLLRNPSNHFVAAVTKDYERRYGTRLMSKVKRTYPAILDSGNTQNNYIGRLNGAMATAYNPYPLAF